jgi:hypothetical protein
VQSETHLLRCFFSRHDDGESREMFSPPREYPPTPTNGCLPARAVTPKGSRYAMTSIHLAPGPTLTIFWSSLIWVLFKLARSIKSAFATLAHPGLGECPPLRTENPVRRKEAIFKAWETWTELWGVMMHFGCNQHVCVLHMVTVSDGSKKCLRRGLTSSFPRPNLSRFGPEARILRKRAWR